MRNKADIGTKHFDADRLEYLRKRCGRAKDLAELFTVDGENLPELNSFEKAEVSDNSCMCDKLDPVIFLAGMTTTIAVQYVVGKLKCFAQRAMQMCRRRNASPVVNAESENTVPRAPQSAGTAESVTVGTPTDVEQAAQDAVFQMLMSFRKDELVGLCRSRNLPVGGNKPDLAARLLKVKRI